jgi:ABC-type transport system involved in multi-copper enzyme maturation permease subunit
MRLGLGPVFGFEWLTTARSWRIYAMRVAFGLGLLVILAMVAMSESDRPSGRATRSIQEQALIGRQFSSAIIATQLTLMLLIAPAATAGTLCLDKARGTLAHVLTTDLKAWEIIFGKLGAKLLPALGVAFSSLGVMAICTLMGGIDPMGLAGAMLVTLGVTVLGSSLALALSVWVGKTHEVVMASYLFIILYLVFIPGWLALSFMGVGISRPPEWLQLGHPFWLALDVVPGQVPIHHHVWFALACLGLSAALAALATWRLRAVAIHQMNRPAGARTKRRRAKRGDRAEPRPGRSWLSVTSLLPAPSLDRNPVLWREWHRMAPSRWSRAIWLVYAAVSLAMTALGVYLVRRPGRTPASEAVLILINGFQVSLGLLLMSVSAATALAEERVRGSLDVLLTTSLPTRSIVLGKWWATFRVVPFLAILPATLVVAAVIWADPRWVPPNWLARHGDWSKWLAPALVVGLILATGAALTSLGLVMATWISRLDRAVMATVSVYVLLALGWPIAVGFLHPEENTTGMGLMSASPFMGVAVTGSAMLNRNMPVMVDRYRPQVAWATFWVLFFLTVAALLLKLELSRFNRKLGRTPDEGMRQRPTPVWTVKEEPVLALV